MSDHATGKPTPDAILAKYSNIELDESACELWFALLGAIKQRMEVNRERDEWKQESGDWEDRAVTAECLCREAEKERDEARAALKQAEDVIDAAQRVDFEAEPFESADISGRNYVVDAQVLLAMHYAINGYVLQKAKAVQKSDES